MIPLCLVTETLSAPFLEKVENASLSHVKSVFEAAAFFQKNPKTVFLILMRDDAEAVETVKVFLEAIPEAKAVVLAEMISPDFEKQVMTAGASDVFSQNISFLELTRRVEKIGNRNSGKGTVESILIVDDDAGVRNFLGLVFKKKGFETLLAESGNQALEMVRSNDPSVVLLDMMMPGMNGLETLKKIREIKPKLGVVMATGLHDEELAHQSMELGAYAYVMKPFDLPYLEMVVLTRLCLAA